jgi:hypothetical protein
MKHIHMCVCVSVYMHIHTHTHTQAEGLDQVLPHLNQTPLSCSLRLTQQIESLCMYVCVNIYVYIYIYIHTHIHTHTQAEGLDQVLPHLNETPLSCSLRLTQQIESLCRTKESICAL